jgi:hypothetical protein
MKFLAKSMKSTLGKNGGLLQRQKSPHGLNGEQWLPACAL